MSPTVFTTQVEEHGDVQIIHLKGMLGYDAYPQLKELLDSLVIADGPRLILNCTRLDYVNSKGLMLLARCQRMAEANNSFFGIASLNSRIIRAVEILGMGKLVKLFPTMDDALAAAADV
ncbi:MAG TPA: STAS domain-containing protein [Kiritimatiellia bacterium]|nr:STAS domain-containing protein [Kiritimatiellia bacterium]